MEMEAGHMAEADGFLMRGDTVAAAKAMGDAIKQETEWDRELALIVRITEIYEEERRTGEAHTVLDGMETVDAAVRHFVWVKLLLRRLEFGLPKEHWQELYHYCKERQVSETMLSSILRTNIIRKEETFRRLIEMYEKNEGKRSKNALFFRGLLRELGGVEKQDGK